MNSNIDLKNLEDEVLKLEKSSRKIKFKNVSFTNIGKKFDEFRIGLLEKKLAKEKKKLVKDEFTNGDLKEKNGSSRAERIIARKSLAIARLEEKINFLSTGEEHSINKIDNRAIKLKDKMMQNLRYNTYGLYSVPEDTKAEIFKEETDKLNETMNTIQQNTPSDEEIMSAIEQKVNEEAKEEVHLDSVEINNIKAAVEESFNNIKSDGVSEVEENANDLNNELENTYVEDYEEKEENIIPIKPIENIKPKTIPAIPHAKISENIPVKGLNDNIFGEGTTIEAEDDNKNDSEVKEKKVEREMPIVVEEREEKSTYEKTEEGISELDNLYEELENTKINDAEKRNELLQKIDEVKEKIVDNKESLTEEEKAKLKDKLSSEKTTEEVKEKSNKDENIQEENIGFDFSDASAKDIAKAVEESSSAKDLDAMIKRIKILQEQERITKERIEKAKEEEKAKEQAYKETIKKLEQYGDELEAKCNQNIENETNIKNKAKEKDEAINFMLKAMEQQEAGNEKKK